MSMFMVWELSMHLQKRVMLKHIQLDFWLFYNSAVGAPLFYSSSGLWSSPCSFASQHTDVSGRCRGLGAGVGGRSGALPGPTSSGCLSQVNKCVCSEIREGRTQTKIPAEELLWQLWFSECEGCWTTGVCRLAGEGEWVCPGSGLLPLCDLKWEEWQFIRDRMSNRKTDPRGR